jgi:hypothetical protein
MGGRAGGAGFTARASYAARAASIFVEVSVCPVHERADRIEQGVAHFGEFVVHPRRHHRVHGPADDPVPFQAAQGDRQHPLADPVHAAEQCGEALRATAKAEDDEQ